MRPVLTLRRTTARGTELLVQHLRALGVALEPRSARVRLEQSLGSDLATLLVVALASQGRRGSSSP